MWCWKKKIQQALGNNNRQSQGNRGKAKSGGKVYQNAGDVIEGISEEELSTLFEELKAQIHIDNTTLQDKLTTSLTNVLISKVAKIIAEVYKDYCIKGDEEELLLTVNDIKGKNDDITQEIQNIITEFQNHKKTTKEIKNKLEEIQRETQEGVVTVCKLCGDILYGVRSAHKQCRDNGIEIDKVKELLTNYIKAAELSNKQLLSAIQASIGEKSEESQFSCLDMNVIAEMFGAIQKIKERVNEGETLDEIVKEYNETLSTQIQKMSYNIANITNTANEILEKVFEVKSTIVQFGTEIRVDIQDSETRIRADIQKLRQQLEDSEQNRQDVLANEQLSSVERETRCKQVTEEIINLQSKIDKQNEKLMREMSKGARSMMVCPYCGSKPSEARMVVDGYCRCDICGKQFVDLNPDMSNISDEEIKEELRTLLASESMKTKACENKQEQESNEWKKSHTAKLEQVSAGKRSGLYRMKLDRYTVSSKGVLIIPNKTHDNKSITQIAFCQPNTKDKDGWDRLSQVKTLFLSKGIELIEYDGKKPFSKSEFKGLVNVMKWDNVGYIVDEEHSPKKQEGHLNA